MAARIEPMTAEPAPKQRRPRITDEHHLAFVRLLPCTICGSGPVDAAHLRAGNLLLGKRSTGMAEKPSDAFVTPLCRKHHSESHQVGELQFWESWRIDPWHLAMALFVASCAQDLETAEKIVAEHRRQALGWTETR